jgi:DNA invertase Pin-like site-specific DNA recombinase
MRKKIADIYVRVSTRKQKNGDGFRRQEELCRKWCEDHGLKVRHVITDVCSAFHSENLNRNLGAACDRWRKHYWNKKGEPLTEYECDEGVVAEKAPDFLVVEDVDRLSRDEPSIAALFCSSILSIGVKTATVMDNAIWDADAEKRFFEAHKRA